MSLSLQFIISFSPLSSNLTFIVNFQSNKAYLREGEIYLNQLNNIQSLLYNRINDSKTEYIRKYFKENIFIHKGLNELSLRLNIPEGISSKLIKNNKQLSIVFIITDFEQDYFLHNHLMYNNFPIECKVIFLAGKNYLRKNDSKQICIFKIDNITNLNAILLTVTKNASKRYSFKQIEDSKQKHIHHNLSYKLNSFSEASSKGSNNNAFDALLNILILMCFCWDCYQCFSPQNDQVNQAMHGRDNVLFSE